MGPVLLFTLIAAVVGKCPPTFDHGVDLDSTRPLILAHQGLSGVYPEHTKMGYQAAVDEGADVIECDVCLTKDLEMVCLHEARLSHTTDVENRTEFASRKKTENVYGTNFTDWFSTDFTLAELKTLKKKQRHTFRDPSFDWQETIPSLDDCIDIAKAAPRKVGIHPEIKDAQWVNSKSIVIDTGKRFEDLVFEKLAARGYSKSTDPCFVQCFDEESVRYMAPRTELPIIQLLGSTADVSQSKLVEYAEIVYGIGPSTRLIVNHYTPENGEKNWISETTDLVERAHALGLKVHAWTVRNEDHYLAWDYKQDPLNEYAKFFELEVDALFTDFSNTMKTYLDLQYSQVDGENCSPSSSIVRKLNPVLCFVVIALYATLV